ncbi:hypothetical protein QTP86_019542, partial [Hemibagrus guttatus]
PCLGEFREFPFALRAPLDIKAGYTLDGVPTHRKEHTLSFTHAITHYGQFRDANQPTIHVFGRGRKLEYQEETPEVRGECANSTQTADAGIKPPPWRCKANVLTTKRTCTPPNDLVYFYSEDLRFAARL